jgi:hypothetical protein
MEEIMTIKVQNPRSTLKSCACGCHCANNESDQADLVGARDAGQFDTGSKCSCVCSQNYTTSVGLEKTMI